MSGDFDQAWMTTPARPNTRQATGQTRDDEIRRRATLLAHLGLPRAHAEAKLRAKVAWEHSEIGKATVLKRLGALVHEAYRRAGVEEKAPASKRK